MLSGSLFRRCAKGTRRFSRILKKNPATFLSVYYIFVELKSGSDKFLHISENVPPFALDIFDKF